MYRKLRWIRSNFPKLNFYLLFHIKPEKNRYISENARQSVLQQHWDIAECLEVSSVWLGLLQKVKNRGVPDASPRRLLPSSPVSLDFQTAGTPNPCDLSAIHFPRCSNRKVKAGWNSFVAVVLGFLANPKADRNSGEGLTTSQTDTGCLSKATSFVLILINLHKGERFYQDLLEF